MVLELSGGRDVGSFDQLNFSNALTSIGLACGLGNDSTKWSRDNDNII